MTSTGQTTAGSIALEAIAMSKRFGSLVALDNVALRLRSGSFHALLGENGAGKSTLVKCIMGYYLPDDGDLIVNNRQQTIANPRDAHTLGIGMVYQHFTLVPNMTVAENLVLARPALPAIINWDHERRELERLLADMPFAVNLNAFAHTLAAGEKQKVEILKQLYLNRHILILDEPTSVLTPNEADEVLGLLHTMTRNEGLTVLMITHKFREVEAFADEVTVLRRGRLAGTGLVSTLTRAEMADMMIGSREIVTSTERWATETKDRRLELDGLSATNDMGVPALSEVSLSLHAGEIVGIAGVSGNGQRELVEVLAGQRLLDTGRIQVNGQPYHATRSEMIRQKVCCLPEEPLHNACVPRMSVAENLAFRHFDHAPFAKAGWWLRHRPMVRAARDLIARYGIRTPSPDAQVGTLSGGNVQRTVLARELGGEVNVLIAANPCFGLDFAAVAEIRSQIMAARNRGVAVLLVSEDLDELLELADRILVMCNGRIVHETTVQTADLATIGHHMAGH